MNTKISSFLNYFRLLLVCLLSLFNHADKMNIVAKSHSCHVIYRLLKAHINQWCHNHLFLELFLGVSRNILENKFLQPSRNMF